MTKSDRLIAWGACLALTMGVFSSDLYLPSWPAMVAHLHTTPAAIQWSLTLFYIGYGVSQPIYGPLSDRHGRRPIMLLGLSLFLIASVLLVLTRDVHWLLVCRLLQGAGAGVTSVVGRSMMCDAFSGKDLERVSSLQAILWSCVPVVAPVFGGYIQEFLGWHWQFVVVSIISLITLIGYLMFIHETHHDKLKRIDVRTIYEGYAYTFKNRVLWAGVVVMYASGALIVGFMAVAPFIFQGLYHLSAVDYGWLMMVMTLGFFIGALLNRLLLRHYDSYQINTVVTACCVLIMLALVLLVWFSHDLPPLPLITFLVFCVFMCTTILYPNAAACAMKSIQKHRGSANALISLVAVMGFGIAPAIMSHLNAHKLLPSMIVLFIYSLVVIVGMLIGRSKVVAL